MVILWFLFLISKYWVNPIRNLIDLPLVYSCCCQCCQKLWIRKS